MSVDGKSDESSKDEPISKVVGKQSKVTKKRKSNAKKALDSDDLSSSSDQPLAKKIKTKVMKKAKATVTKKTTEKKNNPGNTPTKPKPAKPVKSPKVKSEGEGDLEEDYKWWEADNLNSDVKWATLQHKGPLFPPPYEPHGVKMKYDGRPVKLTPTAEEVASFFAALLGTDHANNPTFCKNFFIDFLKVIKDEKEVNINMCNP